MSHYFIRQKFRRFLAVFLFLATPVTDAAATEISGPAKVVDGDTLEIAGQRIRLYGIDAPELEQTCWDERGEFPCGRRAKHMLWLRTKDAEVRCVSRDKDKYGRLIAVCWVRNKDLARTMVQFGWAFAYRKYSEDYVAEEEKAEELSFGLWQYEFSRPCKWRAMMREPLRDPDEFDCR